MEESKSIWVIDDDPIFRMIFSMTVKKVFENFTIVEHKNGTEACNALYANLENQTSLPYCLFMDVNMPGMTGWECLDKIYELVRDVAHPIPKIFIVSSSINPEDQKRALDYPITTDYLTKPISIEKFQEILHAK